MTADLAAPEPPASRRSTDADLLHGVTVPDPYRWLEDDDAPETRAWIESQNRHTRSVLEKIPGREQWAKRLGELYRTDSVGLPLKRGDFYFFSRRKAEEDLASIYYRKGRDGEDVRLVDPLRFNKEGKTSVAISAVSKDGELLAYSVRSGGADEVTIRFVRPRTGEELADELETGRYFSLSIPAEGSGLYYCRHDSRGPRVLFHRWGERQADDRLVFGEGYGQEYIIGAGLSVEERYLLLSVSLGSAAEKNELFVADLRREEAPRALITGIDATFSGAIAGDRLFTRTDWKAPNGRILSVELDRPQQEHWREVLPEDPKATIQGFTLAAGRLAVNLLANVQSRVAIYTPDGAHVRDVTFPNLGTVGSLVGQWDQPEAFVSFSSFNMPPSIYAYRVAGGERDLWHRSAVPFDGSDYVVRQEWFTSRDGTKVPLFLMHRKALKRHGRNPTILYGYGGFRSTLTPSFSPMAAAWVEQGGVWAVANLRGGSEFGEAWHQAGMLDRKQNTFDDFFAAAEWLIREKITSPPHLACKGGSNGGLLVGAALTQRPELFGAVVCTYPLLDMVRYHQFLVARFWIPEYGSSEDPEQFRYIHAYSPYHRVKKGEKYPAVLFITGDADTRVAPLHARKMAALVQWATGANKPVLLDYDTGAGHSGGKPVKKVIEDGARELVFLQWQLGMPEPK